MFLFVCLCSVETRASSEELGLRSSLSRLIAGNINDLLCTEPFGIYDIRTMDRKQLTQALAYLPSQTVVGSRYPAEGVQETLRARGAEAGVPEEFIHSLFMTPLIANDLPTIAVAAAAHACSEYADNRA